MTSPVLSALMALLATGSVAANSNLPPAPLGAIASPPPLTIVLYCTSGLCSASASGESGTGYSFDWISAAEISDGNGQSYARPNCYWYGSTVGVSVTVSDSNGATVTEEYPVLCVEEP